MSIKSIHETYKSIQDNRNRRSHTTGLPITLEEPSTYVQIEDKTQGDTSPKENKKSYTKIKEDR